MHEGTAMDVEAGVPPMVAIEAATLNVAKTFHKDKDFSASSQGKLPTFQSSKAIRCRTSG
jgi:hypothetical protein